MRILIFSLLFASLFVHYCLASPAALSPATCISMPGYLCSSPQLSGYNLSFTFGQSTGSMLYNVQLACAQVTQPNGLPNPTTAFTDLQSITGIINGTLSSGQTVSVSDLPCYGQNSELFNPGSLEVGGYFSGALWINYTNSNAPPNLQNPYLTARFAVVTIRTTPKIVPYAAFAEQTGSILVAALLFVLFARKRK